MRGEEEEQPSLSLFLSLSLSFSHLEVDEGRHLADDVEPGVPT
jgi:hypothetical protein